ncbi:MAG: histidine phosphatase family protein [Bauldia sp.]
MRRLMLLRHCKSSLGEEGLPDRDRPLSKRGQREAESMAEEIAARHAPDRILCSPASRTRETLDPLLARLGKGVDLAVVEELYGEAGDYRAVVAARGGDAMRLLVIGHNPAIEATARALAGSGDKACLSLMAAKFPTGALAVFEIDGDWTELKPRAGRLIAFIRPRDVTGADN